MHGILVTGGKTPKGEIVLPAEPDRFLIAADSGLDFVYERKWKPNLIIGDMDSVSDRKLLDHYGDVETEIHPREKDCTDTELGLQRLWDIGAEKTTIIGGGGGRLDHLLGIYSLFERSRYPKTWLTDKEIVECTEDVVEFSVNPGTLVSIFPVGNEVCRMKSEGLRWKLDTLEWNRGDSGISNESVAEKCRVEVLSGRLLIIRGLPSRILVR